MDILFLTSELQGIDKTGGLGDVAKALPAELARMGHNVKVVMPLYMGRDHVKQIRQIGEYELNINGHATIHYCLFAKDFNGFTIWFVDYGPYFYRNGLYDEQSVAYGDNGERFVFLSICALEACIHQNFRPYVVHCNDWHTSIAAFLLKIRYRNNEIFSSSKSVLTIHNGAYQGVYDRSQFWMVPEINDYASDFLMQGMSYFNLLKIGVAYADEINTVSLGYAQELTTYLGGHGMSKNFAARADHLRGIVNGCDYTDWDPINDTLIPYNYSHNHIEEKNLCKRILQKKLNLDVNDNPMFGMICRLTEQKGINILIPVLENFLVHKVSVVIIGTGDPYLAQQLSIISSKYPKKLVFINSYDETLAHMTEAASDFFLMPSLYEPCGLNQMYSMAYGTLPIVRSVGGLRDTVNDYDHDPQDATGFRFERPESIDLLATMRRALLFFLQEPEEYRRVQVNAMHTKYYWTKSAEQYIRMYKDAHGAS
ncbi:MAG: glycogen synthase GlgA [Succinivibrionaceae bacterium]|nr:glycogen synthase GlgA [Succinivibrionaceae bacterium]